MYEKYILCIKGHRIRSYVATTPVSYIPEYLCFVFIVKSCSNAEVTENSMSYQTSSKADEKQAQVGHRLLVDSKILTRMVLSSYLPLDTNVEIFSSEFSTFQTKSPNQSGPKQSLDRFLLLLINQEKNFFYLG